MAVQNFFKIDKGLNFKPQASAPASPNNGDVYYDSTLGQLRRFENGAWSGFSSGGSGAGKNYLSNKNGDFETGTTTGWSLGNVSLTNKFPSGTPTFGSGASGNLSIATISSGQLAGTYSLSYASSAATTAGDFLASDAFTIDTEDQAKMLTFKLSYKVNSGASNGNFSGTTSSTYGIAIYDVTNSAFIQPAGCYNFVQSSGVGIASGVFQTSASGTSYRILLFNANASAGAITLYIDSISVGPQSYVQGPAMSDWTAYTATLSGFTATTANTKWRRVGDSMEIYGYFTFNVSSGTYNVSLPSGYSIDTTKVQSIVDATLGSALYENATTAYTGNVAYKTTTTLGFVGGAQTAQWGNGTPGGSAAVLSFLALVPIVGWSSNVQMSNDTDTREVSFRGTSTATQSYTNGGTVVVPASTTVYDTHGAWNGTDTYTVPVTGKYKITCFINGTQTAASVSGYTLLVLYQNGAGGPIFGNRVYETTATVYKHVSGSIEVSAKAGDTLQVKLINQSGATFTANGVANENWMTIERLSGPAVVAATESVNAKYNTSTQTVSTSASPIACTNKEFDSHSAYNTSTGVYTVPVSGKYRIAAGILGAATSASTTNVGVTIQARKNSTNINVVGYYPFQAASVSINVPVYGSTIISCNAGDTLDLAVLRDATVTSFALLSGSTNNWISFERIGN